MAGIAAWIMAVNPTLLPDKIEQILKDSCVDLGAPGWDQHYGWGRIDFGEVARRAFATLPLSQISPLPNPAFSISAAFSINTVYALFRTPSLTPPLWEEIANAVITTNNSRVLLQDPAPPPDHAFYLVQFRLSP
jgi:hypothetical protein